MEVYYNSDIYSHTTLIMNINLNKNYDIIISDNSGERKGRNRDNEFWP